MQHFTQVKRLYDKTKNIHFKIKPETKLWGLIAVLSLSLLWIGNQNADLTRQNQSEAREIQRLDREIRNLRLEQDRKFNETNDKLKQLESVKAEKVRLASVQPKRQEPVQQPVVYRVTHADLMTQAGIAPSDFPYVEAIIQCESGWQTTVWNHSGSGAYGLGQALPASKMSPYGADYMTNPVTQLKWASSYAISRYGSWLGAYNYWQSHKWW